jgi:putative membrane protein
LQQSRRGIHQKTILVFAGRLKHFTSADFFAANMQPGKTRFLRFLKSWVINTFAVLVAAIILQGHIAYKSPADLIVAALLLGILNAFVRPILMLLALPLLIFTLGLFTLVINALLLYFVGVLMGPHFQVDSFGFAFLGALIISIVSIALNVMTGGARVTVQRRRPPPKRPGDDDDKPVIDV